MKNHGPNQECVWNKKKLDNKYILVIVHSFLNRVNERVKVLLQNMYKMIDLNLSTPDTKMSELVGEHFVIVNFC